MDYPLLYIQTPPPARRIEEESTSIYVKKESVPSLIMHQLRYFSRPTNKDRPLYFQLKNDEHLVGTIEKLNGEEVLVNALEQKIWLAAESISYISTK
ncbi:4-diphosphocytidyl-2C-methyl-D-erythritol kinase [Lysinibacillus sp. LZ02]|uniref:4-diphosphocytidyl-2C-methyl-D-erythritol kinase n=1 Tax=Lysinibacillus sp. LZ02 TaxID=3420668 RepID=UPI003D3651A2